jgi:hypothetical protein
MVEAHMIVKLVCDFVDLPIEAVKGKCRDRELCEARQLISYLVCQHTEDSYWSIAKLLNYGSHASPIRDERQVPVLLAVDKKFAAKYTPLIEEAKQLADKLDRKRKALLTGKPGEEGDVCWFWNEGTANRFPVLGTFDRSFYEGERVRFVCKEHPGFDYSNCAYAGERILPELFRGRVTPSGISHNLPAPRNLYNLVNTGMLCTA